MSQFPHTRLRRLRGQPWIRDLVAQTRLHRSDFIWPLFIHAGKDNQPISSMPGVERIALNQLTKYADIALAHGIKAIALFPAIATQHKDLHGSEAHNPENIVCQAITKLRHYAPTLGIIADVALDPYTSHGHDGILGPDGDVDNDQTITALAQQALTLAQAGCQMVAPSDMQDGRVGYIRQHLDKHGYHQVSILAYSAKFASHFYGPFRDGVGSQQSDPSFNKASYQLDYANRNQAHHEAKLDQAESADILLVKPAMPYLDIIRDLSSIDQPVFAYQVSGEYSMLMQLAKQQNQSPLALFTEALTGIKRAGAQAILTYYAKDICQHLTS